MKKSMKDLWVSMMSGFVGNLLTAVVAVAIAFMGLKIALPKISDGNGNMLEILKEFRQFIALVAGVLMVQIYVLVHQKIQASRQKSREEAEIRKLELENENIRLQNRQLELQQENQQSSPEE